MENVMQNLQTKEAELEKLKRELQGIGIKYHKNKIIESLKESVKL